jgi:hypothetical protein
LTFVFEKIAKESSSNLCPFPVPLAYSKIKDEVIMRHAPDKLNIVFNLEI